MSTTDTPDLGPRSPVALCRCCYRARTRTRKQAAAVLQHGLRWRNEETLIDRLQVGGLGDVLVLRSGRG
jgi:hypothetical protein